MLARTGFDAGSDKMWVRVRSVLLVMMMLTASACVSRGEAADAVEKDDLAAMSEQQLQALLTQTNTKIEATRKSVEDMKDREFEWREEKIALESNAEQLRGAKNWEAEEKRKRIADLGKLEQSVFEKEVLLRDRLEQIAQLRQEVDAIRLKKELLEDHTAWSERRVRDPGIGDALEESAPELGEDGKLLLNRTLFEFVPEVEHAAHTARRLRARSPPGIVALGAVVLYASSILMCVGVRFTFYTVLHSLGIQDSASLLTLPLDRIIFLCDLCCTVWFAIATLFSIVLREDPICLLHHYSRALFVGSLGLSILVCTLVVFLRVLALSRVLLLPQFGETIVCVILAHHYYLCVWHRSLQHASVPHAFTYYAMYAMLFALLATRRGAEHAAVLKPALHQLQERLQELVAITSRVRQRKYAV